MKQSLIIYLLIFLFVSCSNNLDRKQFSNTNEIESSTVYISNIENLVEKKLRHGNKLNVNLFNVNQFELLEVNIDSVLKLKINSIYYGNLDSNIVSDFLILNDDKDTIYNSGLTIHKKLGLGNVFSCEHTSRYYFSDTTFQYPIGQPYCSEAEFLDEYNLGSAIWYDGIINTNSIKIVPINLKKPIYNKQIILYLTFNIDNLLIKISPYSLMDPLGARYRLE